MQICNHPGLSKILFIYKKLSNLKLLEIINVYGSLLSEILT